MTPFRVASARRAAPTFAVSTRLWDFTRPEPLPDAPRAVLPWAAAPFAKLVVDWGAAGVELDATIPEARFDEVVGRVKDHGLAVASLEALTPHPAELATHAPRPGLVPLANPDASERAVAVRLHRRVIERAADVGAPIVVLTLGAIRLEGLETPEGERETRAFLARRAEEASAFTDATRFALDDLLPAAERLGRRLAVATSGDLAAVPSFQELRALLDDFRGAPLAAWVDVAGIHRLERAGVRRVATWASLGESIAGVRLRDQRDSGEAVPGEGELDWAALHAALTPPPGATRVLSLSAAHDLGRVRESISHLRRAGWLA